LDAPVDDASIDAVGFDRAASSVRQSGMRRFCCQSVEADELYPYGKYLARTHCGRRHRLFRWEEIMNNNLAYFPRTQAMQYPPRRQWGLQGLMSGVGDPVRQGSQFALCIEFTDYYEQIWPPPLADTMAAISTAIQNSGATQGLVRVYQLAGVVNPFICVEALAGHDYSHAYDLRDGVLAVIASQYSGINYGTVRFQATTYNPQTGETAESRTDTPEGSGPPVPETSFFDSIAKSLGVGKDEAQLLVFGGAALLLVMVMKR